MVATRSNERIQQDEEPGVENDSMEVDDVDMKNNESPEDGDKKLQDSDKPRDSDFDIDVSKPSDPFYLRYYAGHQGRYGHEFLEFDLRVMNDGQCAILRYANNSNYRNESLIKKQVTLSPTVFKEFKRLVAECEILKEDDYKWPPKNRDGKQELEVRLGKFHISFETSKIGSMNEVQNSDDPNGLRVFYYLVADLKALVFSLIQCHFKIKPFA